MTVLLAGARLAGGRTVDVLLDGAGIVAVDAVGRLASDVVHDLSGYLLLPAPVEPHAHLDKAGTADDVDNADGDLGGAVAAWLRYRPTMTHEEIVTRATAAARASRAQGVTAVRSHVDVASDIGLRGLVALSEVRDALADELALQLVAFVGTPVTGTGGAGHRALLADALDAGADVVGGAPGHDPDPAGAIEVALDAARRAGRPVDLHVDESLDAGADTLSLLAEAAAGFPHPVAASHCVGLGMLPPDEAARVADRVAAAGITVICLPLTNLYLQGRDRPAATPRGLTALRTLRAAGVTVAAGGDNVQDPFNPLGRGDPLETAALLVLAGHETPADAYAAVSAGGRGAMGLPPVEVAPGFPAELMAIRAGSVREAIASAGPDRLVFSGGRLVSSGRAAGHR